MTGFAFELATGRDAVGFGMVTTRADRIAVGFRPAHFTERLVSRIFASLIDALEAQGAGSC